MVVHAVVRTLDEAEEAFNGVRRNLEVFLFSNVFLAGVVHGRMLREHWLHHVVDGRFIGNQVRGRIDVLLKNRLDIGKLHALKRERPNATATFHQRQDRKTNRGTSDGIPMKNLYPIPGLYVLHHHRYQW